VSFIYVYGAAFTLCLLRLLKGPTFADRMMSLDAMANILIVYIVYMAVASAEAMYLDMALILAMISFVGTMAVAKYARGK